jgi:hypothetical protein
MVKYAPETRSYGQLQEDSESWHCQLRHGGNIALPSESSKQAYSTMLALHERRELKLEDCGRETENDFLARSFTELSSGGRQAARRAPALA